MPSLIVEYSGQRTGTTLNGRTSIGRGDDSEIVVDHPTVSRIHAWIESEFGGYFISDTGSRNGTFVDGERISGRQRLRDGARIRVGPARMIFRLAPLTEIAPKLPQRQSAQPHQTGIVFTCSCGARLWVPAERAGESGRCKRCGGPVDFPLAQDLEALDGTAPEESVAVTSCSICQCEIHKEETRTTCPACGLAFHEECWLENKGCSAYGCSQVNALAEEEEEVYNEEEVQIEDVAEEKQRVRWELGFLLVSLPLSVMGAILFGILPLAGAVLCTFCLKHDRKTARKGIALTAIALMTAGALAGFVFSMSYWLKVPLGRWIGR